jgi:GT2 family glycosyltransferase
MTPDEAIPSADIAVVAIGRNEGDRLERCLRSLQGRAGLLVYVDSGSTDGSVALAQGHGARVVALDMAQPFTAARARNAGWQLALQTLPTLRYVQFVDGDCEVAPAWVETACRFLDAEPRVAAACGRRRERFPERSVYNLLCDLEWNTPIGDAKACGGDVMMRASALAEAGGYREDLIAGEEPELCVRLRARGWRIHRLDAEMTLHDAAITHAGQWWRRTTRNGFAFAEGAHLHGAPPERHWVRESRSAWVWGLGIPALTAVAMVLLGTRGAWLLTVYPLQMLRMYTRLRLPPRARLAQAVFLVLAKFPEAVGQLKYLARSWRGGPARLIEYK